MENKYIKGLYNTFYWVLLVTIMTACGGGDSEPTEQELTFEKLSGTWNLSSITLDGQPIQNNYPNFSLSFSAGTYNTSNAGNLFKASGTWSWGNGTTTTLITLDDGKSITIQTLTTTVFTISFTQTDGATRAGINGNYIISFVK